jgi:hypothetical protein
MNEPTARALMPVPIPLLAVVALVAALLVGMGSTHDPAHAGAHAAAHAETGSHAAAAHAMTAKEAAFQDRMRKLWEDHIVWTRMAIVTFADGSDGFSASADRLLRNQRHLGNAIEPFYGTRAGNRLNALLRDHILIAVDVLKAAQAGDTAAFDKANKRWYANGRDVADFISSLNHRAWPRSAVRSMMKGHLDQTLAEAAAELGGDYKASVTAYDEIHRHILAMADALSSGIMAQFPHRFGR